MVFFEPFLIKFRSILTLQAWAKGTIHRCRLQRLFNDNMKLVKLNPSKPISVDNTKYSHYAIANRAASVICRAIRDRKLRMRVNTLVAIVKYLNEITSPVLYLEQNIYLYLERIV